MSQPRRQREYNPARLRGETVEELRREMQRELDAMALVLKQLSDMDYLPQGKEPERFTEGSVAFFIGGIAVTGIASTIAGLHQFRAGAWRRLGESV